MSNMRRKISSRDFVHRFSKVQAELKPGQTVIITNRGKTIGEFVKTGQKTIKLPDFEKDAKADGLGPEVGDALLKRLLADEAFS
jgi:antitoxin (DNA-binding transcriptional repressor) of toxin-antitoxin stability system